MHIENNINKLFDRYKKSQNLLDNLTNQPLLSTMHNEMTHTSFQSKPFTHVRSKMLEDDSSSREKRRYKKDNNQTEQISRLKDTIWLKENMDKERTDKMGMMNRELKIQLRESLDKIKELERHNYQRDGVLRQFEEETKMQQDNVNQYNQHIRENRLKEESQNRMIEEIKESYHQQKSKMAKKKAKITQIQQQFLHQEKQFDQQSQQFGQELERVQKLCEDFSIEIKEQEQRNAQLEQDLNRLSNQNEAKDAIIQELQYNYQENRKREQELIRSLENEQGRANDLKNKLEQQQTRSEQIQNELQSAYSFRDTEVQRFEDEMRRLTVYYETEVEKKKHKNLELRNQANEADYQIQKQGKDIINLNKDLGLQEQEIRLGLEAKKSVEGYILMVSSLEHRYNKTLLELNDQQNQNKQIQKTLQQSDEDKHAVQKQVQELTIDIQNLSDNYQQLQRYSSDLEKQIQQDKYEQNEAMNDIDKKIDQLVSQLSIAQQEIQSLKNKELDLKRAIKQDEDVVLKYKSKNDKFKKTIEELKLQLRNVEDKQKENQKQEVVRSYQDQQVQQVKSKLRVLDDIQSMIQTHKQSIHY